MRKLSGMLKMGIAAVAVLAVLGIAAAGAHAKNGLEACVAAFPIIAIVLSVGILIGGRAGGCKSRTIGRG